MGGWELDICDNKPENELMVHFRLAQLSDIKVLSRFTDWWLSGRGRSKGISGAVDDCFISAGQHKKYVSRYTTLLALRGVTLVGWAVVEPSGTMIHLLIAGNYRGQGIGKLMMHVLRPKLIRSKFDQSSGNPIGFYLKLGYTKVKRVQSRSRLDIDRLRPARKPNIDILQISDI